MNRSTIIILLVLITSCIFFNSCRPDYKAELLAVDKLMHQYNQVDSLYQSIDTANVEAIANQIERNVTAIQTTYVDTMPAQLSVLVNDYFSVQESVDIIKVKHADLKNELTLCAKQIANLKQDLEHGEIEELTYKAYIKEEEQALNTISESLNSVAKVIKSNNTQFEKLNPQITQIVEKIER